MNHKIIERNELEESHCTCVAPKWYIAHRDGGLKISGQHIGLISMKYGFIIECGSELDMIGEIMDLELEMSEEKALELETRYNEIA